MCDERAWLLFSAPSSAERSQALPYAFDLLELNGQNLRQEPIEVRKATFASILRKSRAGCGSTSTGIPDGRPCFSTPARWGWKALSQSGSGSRYRSGRSRDWLKFKKPKAPAVRREAEEDWTHRPED